MLLLIHCPLTWCSTSDKVDNLKSVIATKFAKCQLFCCNLNQLIAAQHFLFRLFGQEMIWGLDLGLGPLSIKTHAHNFNIHHHPLRLIHPCYPSCFRWNFAMN